MPELRGPYYREAEAFIENTIQDNQGNPVWDSRDADRQLHWLEGVRCTRSNISPAIFDYADRRNKGLEPPPSQYTWPRSKEHIKYDRAIRRRGMDQPQDNQKWQEVDWKKSSSKVDAAGCLPDDEIDSGRVPEPNGTFHRSDGSLEVSSDLPKVKISIDPERIQRGRMTVPEENSRVEQNRKWEQDSEDPHRETKLPSGFTQHPGRPWTKGDEENLLDIIEGGERDFARISHQTQRTQNQCHRKYRYLASLEVEEPRIGEWTAEQDAEIAKFVEEYKITDWDRIAFQCGTTYAEARQHWASLSSANSNRPIKSNKFNAKSRATVTSATTGAMMDALDDLFSSEDNPKKSTTASVKFSSPPSDHSENDHHPAAINSIVQTQTFKPEAAAALQEPKPQAEVLPKASPKVATKGRKRAHGDEAEGDSQQTLSQQPERKVRRTGKAKTASARLASGPASTQQAWRSTKPGRGEKNHDDHFLFYDPDKVKSLSNKSSDDIAVKRPAPLPATKEVKPNRKQAVNRIQETCGAKTKEVANHNSDAAMFPVPNTAVGGRKCAHVDVEDAREGETSRVKMRRTANLKAAPESGRTAAAMKEAATSTQPHRRSSRVSERRRITNQESTSQSVAGPGTIGRGRKRGREANPDTNIQEECLAKKTKKGDTRTAQAPKVASKLNNSGHTGPGQTHVGAVAVPKKFGGGQKRRRETESEVEEEPQRELRPRKARQLDDSNSTSNPENVISAAPRPRGIFDTPADIQNVASGVAASGAGPRIRPRKPGHRVGIDRRSRNYPPKYPPHR